MALKNSFSDTISGPRVMIAVSSAGVAVPETGADGIGVRLGASEYPLAAGPPVAVLEALALRLIVVLPAEPPFGTPGSFRPLILRLELTLPFVGAGLAVLDPPLRICSAASISEESQLEVRVAIRKNSVMAW